MYTFVWTTLAESSYVMWSWVAFLLKAMMIAEAEVLGGRWVEIEAETEVADSVV